MTFKRVAIAALTSIVLLTGSTVASAAVYWPTAADGLTKTTFAVESQENFASSAGYSILFNAKDQLCETLGESPCNNIAGDSYTGSYILPVCASATQLLCLEAVNIYKGTKASATLIRAIDAPTAPVNAAAAAAKIPAGGSTTLWTGADGKTYAVSVEVQIQIQKGKLTANTFSAVVNPYTQVFGSYTAAKIIRSGGNTYIDDSRDLNCAWVESGVCGELQDFDTATRVGLSFRMGKPSDQLLSARLAKPTLNAAKAAGTNQVSLTVEGAPVSVQQLSLKMQIDKAPAGLNIGGAPRGQFNYSLDTTKNVTALRTSAGNKASGVRTFWSVTNQDDSRVTQSTKCKAASGIAGVVASDAMIADNFNPVKTAGSLKQTINGLLNNPDGKADAGSFDLVLADDFARCVFGLAKGGLLKAKATGGAVTTKATTAWISASLTGIKYAASTTASVTITR